MISTWLRSFFGKAAPKPKAIAFLDGDQDCRRILGAYHQHLKNTQTLLVRHCKSDSAPRGYKSCPTVEKVWLGDFADLRKGKEAVDKFIGIMMQQKVADGYTDFTVVSCDYDFVDLFKMLAMTNPDVQNLKFRLIVPKGNVSPMMGQTQTNIEIVRMK